MEFPLKSAKPQAKVCTALGPASENQLLLYWSSAIPTFPAYCKRFLEHSDLLIQDFSLCRSCENRMLTGFYPAGSTDTKTSGYKLTKSRAFSLDF